jgi:hypothetical protein
VYDELSRHHCERIVATKHVRPPENRSFRSDIHMSQNSPHTNNHWKQHRKLLQFRLPLELQRQQRFCHIVPWRSSDNPALLKQTNEPVVLGTVTL